jgi:hypothetical protein
VDAVYEIRQIKLTNDHSTDSECRTEDRERERIIRKSNICELFGRWILLDFGVIEAVDICDAEVVERVNLGDHERLLYVSLPRKNSHTHLLRA